MDIPHIQNDADWGKLVHQLNKPSTEVLGSYFPTTTSVATIVENLRHILLAPYFNKVGGDQQLCDLLRQTQDMLLGEVSCCLQGGQQSPEEAQGEAATIVTKALNSLPEIQSCLERDIDAAFQMDPSVLNKAEAVSCLPGINAMVHYRIAHCLWRLKVPTLPRFISSLCQSATGIDIHPSAQLGDGIFMDHGTGIVVGATAIIGNNVTIYQGVTLGAKSFPRDQDGQIKKGLPRHPIVEDDVTIYAGATILGRITIGKGAVIGGNVWITQDIARGAQIRQTPFQQSYFHQGSGI